MNPGDISNVKKAVFSVPREGCRYKKAAVTMKTGYYQVESFTETQAFHENFPEIGPELDRLYDGSFKNCVVWDGVTEYSFRETDSGRRLFKKRPFPLSIEATAHNRNKNYLLPEGADVPALYDMGIFTKEGRVAAPMRSKYRQINRFMELVDDGLRPLKKDRVRVIDFGCGKSYLTFIIYHYLTRIKGVKASVTGLDLKEDVIMKCREAAARYGYADLDFEVGDIKDYSAGEAPDMVMTLHACDTATDYALFNAVSWGASLIFSVPCCQHEANRTLRSEELSGITRWGILKERTSAIVTDAVRACALTACGYRTQVVEFIEMEHTPKNLLIRASKGGVSAEERQNALEELRRLQRAFGVDLTLPRLLGLE